MLKHSTSSNITTSSINIRLKLFLIRLIIRMRISSPWLSHRYRM